MSDCRVLSPKWRILDRVAGGVTRHYRPPPARWSRLDDRLRALLGGAFGQLGEPVLTGSPWTTDAPYCETATAIVAAQTAGVACVETEVAALDTYAEARDRRVVCLAHITNTMATEGDDFERVMATAHLLPSPSPGRSRSTSGDRPAGGGQCSATRPATGRPGRPREILRRRFGRPASPGRVRTAPR